MTDDRKLTPGEDWENFVCALCFLRDAVLEPFVPVVQEAEQALNCLQEIFHSGKS